MRMRAVRGAVAQARSALLGGSGLEEVFGERRLRQLRRHGVGRCAAPALLDWLGGVGGVLG